MCELRRRSVGCVGILGNETGCLGILGWQGEIAGMVGEVSSDKMSRLVLSCCVGWD